MSFRVMLDRPVRLGALRADVTAPFGSLEGLSQADFSPSDTVFRTVLLAFF